MKHFTKYLILFIILLMINGCDKPAPTELVQEEDPLEIELITKDTEDELYSSGYDSTGVVYNPSRGFANIITVSGIKTSYRNSTFSTSHAQAIFFDKSSQVLSPDGRLIGFHTRILGNVDFNTKSAKLREFRIWFKDRITGNIKDTLLGFRHILHHKPLNQDDNFNFRYNSSVSFDFDPVIGNPVHFNIPTPSEINGLIRFEGQGNNLAGSISWNAGAPGHFEIIIGGSHRGNHKVFPLYRLKTRDDGRLEIPKGLLNHIPLNRFERFVFSIIRKNEFHIENNDNDLFILSQSIHSLVVDIP